MQKFQKKYPKTYKFMKGTGKAIDIASKAYGIAKTVAALVNAERQIYQIVPSNFQITTTPTVTNLAPMVQGTAVNQRKGTSVAIASIYMTLAITWNSLGAANQSIRQIVLYDKNEESAALAAADVPLLLSVTTVEALRTVDTRKRFKVLSDRLWTWNTEKDATFSKLSIKLGRKDKNGAIQRHHVDYVANNAWGKGQLYVIHFSNTAAGSNPPSGILQFETHYYDN